MSCVCLGESRAVHVTLLELCNDRHLSPLIFVVTCHIWSLGYRDLDCQQNNKREQHHCGAAICRCELIEVCVSEEQLRVSFRLDLYCSDDLVVLNILGFFVV